MSRINVDLLNARASEIRRYLTEARSYASLPSDEFNADVRNQYAVEHLLLLAIESAATICTHLLAKSAGTSPSGYTDCFLGLRDIGIVSPELGQRLANMARFRNMLVHRYLDVDPGRVVLFVREESSDLEEFLASVGEWLDRQER